VIDAKTIFPILAKVLRYEEGVKPFAYDDATGKKVEAPIGQLTIGVGHNLESRGLNPLMIEIILQDDMLGAAIGVEQIFDPADLAKISIPRVVALAALSFQLGTAGLTEFPRMNAAVRMGDWELAAQELMHSLLARQCPDRTKRMAQILRSDGYPEEYGL
jgi:lysozyme